VTRVVIISDMHAGHRAGLCCPGWQTPESAPGVLGTFARQQRAMWAWYSATMASLQPIDVLIVNGDAFEGKGKRNQGVELITSDMMGQCQIAAACINEAKAKAVRLTSGTPCHTSPDGDDWEDVLLTLTQATSLDGHLFVEIEGVVFDIKHKVGSSGIPHGRHTAVSKERLWNVLWHERQGAPLANVIIRSHVHYHEFSGNPTHLAMTTPALQGFGSKYGERQCSGVVDIGFVHFDVEDGAWSWQAHLFQPKADLLKR
jgi:hypothetical protein